ncbi:hypothetical protein Tco_0056644 [Tanacetum coccineum]
MFVVRNTLKKEPVPQELGRLISGEALWEYCDRNYHKILPIIAEKVHQEKEHPSKEEASRKGSDQDLSATDPKVLSQGMTAPNLLRKRVRKGKQCSKGWKKVCSTGSEKKVGRRMCPHIQETQCMGHTIAVAGTQKAAKRVLALEKQKLLSRNTTTRESTREERKHCQKVKEV